jgi:hypothetical protein
MRLARVGLEVSVVICGDLLQRPNDLMNRQRIKES